MPQPSQNKQNRRRAPIELGGNGVAPSQFQGPEKPIEVLGSSDEKCIASEAPMTYVYKSQSREKRSEALTIGGVFGISQNIRDVRRWANARNSSKPPAEKNAEAQATASPLSTPLPSVGSSKKSGFGAQDSCPDTISTCDTLDSKSRSKTRPTSEDDDSPIKFCRMDSSRMETAAAEESAEFHLQKIKDSIFTDVRRKSSRDYAKDDTSSSLTGKDVLDFLERSGLQLDDPRIKAIVNQCESWDVITEERAAILLGSSLIRRALRKDLAFQNFEAFTESFREIFKQAGENPGGNVATYIPQLAKQNPNYWAATVCSIDGQRFGIGDVDVPCCVQSTSKPITYCAALELNGERKVHQFVGREPSGRNFNDRCLMARPGQPSIPHNPYINAGAIMTASLVKMDTNEWDRYKYMMGIWQRLCGGVAPSYQNDTFMGERANASRNFCLAYMMQEEQAFPVGTHLQKTLDAYFTWCAIEITPKSMAIVAATLANGGICPMTTERIFSHQTVTNCLSLMMSCGMYDYSGRFAFEIGFPAKSSVSGVLCVVIPGVCGISTFSPRLDSLFNSVRGIDFCVRLSNRFPYHVFSQKKNADEQEEEGRRKRRQSYGIRGGRLMSSQNQEALTDEDGNKLTSSLWWSAARDDVQRIRQLAVRGVDINVADCDKRTALHLAASQGHEATVRLLVLLQADVQAKDHHGNTPLMDAVREHRNAAKRTLQLASRKAAKPETPALKTNSTKTEKRASPKNSLLTATDLDKKKGGFDLFAYFTGNAIVSDGAECVPHRLLVETLDSYGISTDSDRRFAFLDNVPDPFTMHDLERAARMEPVLSRALSGKLAVPNFNLLCEKFEDLFSKMAEEAAENQSSHQSGSRGHDMNDAAKQEALNVMTVDGQRLHLGAADHYICAGDLISLALFAVSIELLDLDVVKEFVGTEPSGVKSNTMVLNSDNLPYNPFMWNGVLALCSLLEENIGDAIAIMAQYWAKLCGSDNDECPMQHDEVFEEEDKRKNFNKIQALVYTSMDLQTFPRQTPPNIVVSTFFRLRAIKTSTMDLGSIAAVFANGGVNPITNIPIFGSQTVKYVLSIMYSAGCEAQSGELSFKVGVPAKSSSEGAIMIVWPNVLGLCVVSPEVQENGVSKAGVQFCADFGNDFNCHVLSGSATSSAKQDPSLYHFKTDIGLCNQLLFAAEYGDMAMLSNLHQLGFSLDYANYDYRSAAHVAAANGRIGVLKYLFKRGADMEARDRWGVSPIDDASRNGHHKTAAVLRDMLGKHGDDRMHQLSDTASGDSSLELTRRGSSDSTKRRSLNVSARNAKSVRNHGAVAATMGGQSNSFVCIQEAEEDELESRSMECKGSRSSTKEAASVRSSEDDAPFVGSSSRWPWN